ncbi:MAG: SGNH/GDSL hydrolase family protein [Kiritimatiellae bacterium]|nr:SGNH/GDSL hydrolase family protein [Kiritimatiellia bacterium]
MNAYVKTAAAALLAATAFGEMSDAERHHSTEMNSAAYAADRKAAGGVKVLFIGNSITLHGPNAAIGWTNNWGMAASAAEKDFVHIVTREVERRLGRRADLVVRNYANFERDFRSWDWSKTEELAKEDPDVLVVALGENVRSLKGGADRLAWRDAFKRLLGAFLDGRNTKPLAVVRGSFWPDAAKDWAMAYAASDYAIPFVKADVYRQPGMDASDAGFSHPGVRAHPGDRGMAEIAARIVEGLFPEKSGYEAWMDGLPVKVHAIQVSAMEYNRLFTGFQRPADQTERAGFAAVEAKGATSWRVKCGRDFRKAVVRPLSAGVKPAVKDGAVEFKLPKCGHYVLELDDYHRPLEIFVEPENDFAEYRRTATVTFGPGVHLTRGVRLRSHDRVYIDKDAVVYGGFAMDGVEDVQIRGYGIICGTTCRRVTAYYNRNPDDKAGAEDMMMRQLTPIRARRSKRIVVEGPVVVDSCEWCVATFGCEDVDVSHLKITGAWRYNTDASTSATRATCASPTATSTRSTTRWC